MDAEDADCEVVRLANAGPQKHRFADRIRTMANVFGVLVAVLGVLCGRTFASDDRPNILWITAEDMSPTLGCYGDEAASTPNIDALAAQGTRYSHAFATAPVCSPSRSCLIHGCLATTTGTHPMRSTYPLPAAMLGLPALLREQGYHTSNNVKTDYNTAAEPRIVEASWDACSVTADWSGRQSDQPFFSVINLMTTHQSRTMVWPQEQFESEVQSLLPVERRMPAENAPIPPYYPDTPLVRKTVARYYDCVAVMDRQVGEILNRLRSDGLDENTIVFFFSDHGSGMPRHKRALLDSGMRVPLIVRFPKRFAKWAPTVAGQWSDRLVCFEDFLPTVLSLASIGSLPTYVRGLPFLGVGSDSSKRSFAFGHRDRVDEIRDTARSVRGKRYLYIRNFMPHLGYNQQNAWCDQGAIRRDFYALAASGRATPAQAHYLSPRRPVEELYDCRADPLNLNNLADSSEPAHQQTLQRMREALKTHVLQSRDLGFVPETELHRISAHEPPMRWAASEQFEVEAVFDAAMHVGRSDPATIGEVLRSTDPSIRYWGVLACASVGSPPHELASELEGLLDDPCEAVRIEAAGTLARGDRQDVAYPVLLDLLDGDNRVVILHAARTLELLGDPRYEDTMQQLFDRFEKEPGDMAWFIRFSTTGYLNRLGQEESP